MAEINEAKLQIMLKLVEDEVRRIIVKNEKFNSAHEGYAILLEEVDELKAEVWKKKKTRDRDLMEGECKQVAALAVRFMHDLL
jgi:hypothetical protein